MKTNLRNKKNGKVEKGITLVALVVTIVVLLILAGVSIVTLFGENGIITAAQKAADQTKNSVNKDLEELAELEGMLTGWQEVKEDGKVIKVKKGKMEINIGDYINYDCTKNASGQAITESYTSKKYDSTKPNQVSSGYNKDQTFKAKDYTGKWMVLGAENGELLITSATTVPLTVEGSTSTSKIFNLGKSGDTERNKVGYKYGIEELNNISEIYSKGKGSIGARSIKVEDVNKITGYDPKRVENIDNNPYGKNNLFEYGNEVTYTWKGENAPYYTSSNGYRSGTCGYDHRSNGFIYWDVKKNDWVTSPYTSTEQTSPFTSLISTGYFYNWDESKLKDSGKKVLCSEECRDFYLASRVITPYEGDVAYGYLVVINKSTMCCRGALAESEGGGTGEQMQVRPVVSLSSDVKLTPVTDGGGIVSYNIN